MNAAESGAQLIQQLLDRDVGKVTRRNSKTPGSEATPTCKIRCDRQTSPLGNHEPHPHAAQEFPFGGAHAGRKYEACEGLQICQIENKGKINYQNDNTLL